MRINKILSQKYRADINIVPKLSLSDYFNVFGNPTSQIISRYRSVGMEAAQSGEHPWLGSSCRLSTMILTLLGALAQIERSCRLEIAIDTILGSLCDMANKNK